ncbi:MAG: hypothetical protein AABX85_03215 [Nanoarchaeota archaeon]
MEKKQNHFGIVLFVIFILSVVHGAIYLTISLNDNSKSAGTNSISGLSIKKIPENQNNAVFPFFSEMFIVLEWMFLILGTVFMILKQKIDLRKEIINLYITKKYYTHEKKQTDIDVLYGILQEKKHLKIASISKVFHIPRETATEWAKILESGNLASMYYPQFGDPEIILSQ